MKRYRIDEQQSSLIAQDDADTSPDGTEELINLLLEAHESRQTSETQSACPDETPETLDAAKLPAIEVDGERIVLSAEKEIVLQCGEASITLTRSGKIIIRGAYVSSRSTGVNRIQGGSVEIN